MKGKGRAAEVEEARESPRIVAARQVKAVFERVYARWQVLVATKGEEGARAGGLERFDEGACRLPVS